MSESTWQAIIWNIDRTGGFVAYILLTLSIVLGLALSMRWQAPRWPRLITNELHSYLTLLSLVFIAIHVLAVAIDPYTRFGWKDILIPMATTYRPIWMAAGIVGLYLMLAVWISSQFRSRIPYTLWRKLHTLAFGTYVLSTIHGLGTGTDTRHAWAIEIYLASVLAVGALMINRLLTPAGTRGKAHPRLAMLTGVVILSGALWAMSGPLQSGWSVIASHVP